MTMQHHIDSLAPPLSLPRPQSVAEELARLTPLAQFRGLEIHAFAGDECPATLRMIGWLREQGFSAAGAGRGQALDLDALDTGPTSYQQLVAWDPSQQELVALYRFRLGSEAATSDLSTLRTYALFDYSARFRDEYLPVAIELGRSVVNRKARRHTLGFFATWVGLGALLRTYPTTRYFFGNVSLYESLPVSGRDRLVAYMETVYAPGKRLLVARPAVKYESKFDITGQVCEVLNSAEGRIAQLRELLAPFEMSIPPVLQSYMSLGTGIHCGETVIDADFGGALELGIVVPVAGIDARIRKRFIDVAS